MRRTITALLAAAILCSLCACGPAAPSGSGSALPPGGSSSRAEGEGPAQPPGESEGPTQPPGESEAAQSQQPPQVPERDLSWDPSHTLSTSDRPENHGGLELPLRGATGYASVELGLWEVRPDLMPEPEPEPEPEPVPQPGDASSAQPDEAAGSTAGASGQDSQEGTGSQGEGDSPDASQTEEAASASSAQPEPEPPASSAGQAPPEGSPAASGQADPQEPVPQTPEQEQPQGEPEEDLEEEPEPDPFQGAMAVLEPGAPFVILEEYGDWWRVNTGALTGWVEHRWCMVNLPDVIPSMIYDATNSYDSLYRTSGREIPGVTGESLYTGKTYNQRLGREEYMMPVLYSMALKICRAQRAALEEGNTLVLYEGYRPYSTQKAVRDAVSGMAEEDPEVKAGVSDPPWSQTWFISNGYSNHQKGYAIDVSLAKVWETRRETCGDYTYLAVTDATRYEMPTPMHELSMAAATFTAPVAVNSETAWKSAQLADTMNQPALGLQRYCTQAGLTPLSSEWWHFNDLETRLLVQDRQGTGGFEIAACLSTKP